MRQEVRRLTEQIVPEVVVLDADMDVHAADHEAPRHLLQVLGEDVVAFLVGVVLRRPFGEGMGRGGDQGEAEFLGDGADGLAQIDELVARLLDRMAHRGADLDLRAQEFGAHLPLQGFLAFGEEGRRRRGLEVPALLVDEEVLLLNAEREAWFADGHGAIVSQSFARV